MMKKKKKVGLVASEWERLFRKARVADERLGAARTPKAKVTIIGGFLTKLVGREVQVDVGGKSGTAKLCSRSGRSRQKEYYFEVVWDRDDETSEASTAVQENSGKKRTKRRSRRGKASKSNHQQKQQ